MIDRAALEAVTAQAEPRTGHDAAVVFPQSDVSGNLLAHSILRAVAEAPQGDLPSLVGALAQAQAAAIARLVAPAPAHAVGAPGPDENLPIQEAARRLNVSKDWLYRHGPNLPFRVKIGSRVAFSAHGLERWNRQRMGR